MRYSDFLYIIKLALILRISKIVNIYPKNKDIFHAAIFQLIFGYFYEQPGSAFKKEKRLD